MVNRFCSKDSFFVRKVLSWFRVGKRDLPWRETRDPYAIWVSEIMLQQTQVDRVRDFYVRFLERFPDVSSLAKASWEEFLPYFRGLGYYARGRNMLKAARVLSEQYDCQFPRDVSELEKLPGVGKYTARAIASFAFGLDVPVKDTNVSRVLKRFFGIQEEDVWPKMSELVPKGDSSNFNQGVMELGALVCSAFQPKCPECVLKKECDFFVLGKSMVFSDRKKGYFPDKKNLIVMKNIVSKNSFIHVAVGIIYRDGKILIAQRRDGLYEFPGGKIQKDEDARTAMKREAMEELGVEVSVRPAFLRTVAFPYVLNFHRCQILLGEPRGMEGQTIQWISIGDFGHYQFPPANREVLERILEMRW